MKGGLRVETSKLSAEWCREHSLRLHVGPDAWKRRADGASRLHGHGQAQGRESTLPVGRSNAQIERNQLHSTDCGADGRRHYERNGLGERWSSSVGSGGVQRGSEPRGFKDNAGSEHGKRRPVA
jgi:hypothetical protein